MLTVLLVGKESVLDYLRCKDLCISASFILCLCIFHHLMLLFKCSPSVIRSPNHQGGSSEERNQSFASTRWLPPHKGMVWNKAWEFSSGVRSVLQGDYRLYWWLVLWLCLPFHGHRSTVHVYFNWMCRHLEVPIHTCSWYAEILVLPIRQNTGTTL